MTYHAGPSIPQSEAAAEAVRRETGRTALVISRENKSPQTRLP
jgi:hypothetical protein